MPQIYNNNLSPTLWGSQGNTNNTATQTTNTAEGNVGELQYNNGGNLDGVTGTSYANGVLALGNVANLAISGGIPGQFLGINEVGQLTFKETTQRAQPQIKFAVTTTGAGQSFANNDLDLFADGTYAQVFRNGVLVDSGDYQIQNNVLSLFIQLFAGDTITVGATSTGAKPVGSVGTLNLNGDSTTYLNGVGQFTQVAQPNIGTVGGLNLDGNTSHWLRGDGTFSELQIPGGNIANVNLNGNTIQYLRGDGNWSNIPVPTGNIANTNYNGNAGTYLNGQGAWAEVISGGIPGGITTQLQYNNNGVFAGIPNVVYDGSKLSLGDVTKLTITGAASNSSVLLSDTSGGLSWGNLTNYRAIPRIEFTAITAGSGQSFVNANLAYYPSTDYMNVYKNGVYLDPTNFSLSGNTLTWTSYLRVGDHIDIAASAIGSTASGNVGTGTVTSVSTAGSGLGFSVTGGPITSTGTITLNTPNAASLRTSLTIGNVANANFNGNGSQFLRGNGTFGVPSIVAGSNSELQFNNAGVLGATANLTYDIANNRFSVQGTTELLDNVTLEGSITPINDNLYDLGSPSRRFRHIYVGPNSLTVGGVAISENSGGGLSLGGDPAVTAPNNTITIGNIVANTISGNGANITGVLYASSANTANSATVAASANTVSGANVTGIVANAQYAATVGTVSLANISGLGNIANINLNGNSSQVLAGNGSWVAQTGGGSGGPGVAWTSTANIAVGDLFTGYVAADITPGSTYTPTDTGSYFKYADVRGQSSINKFATDGNTIIGVGSLFPSSSQANMYKSTDGVIWTQQLSGSTVILRDITFANNLWVSVGESGKIITSTDGTNWTTQTSGTVQGLKAVTWTGTLFIAVGNTGTIITSPDGTTWTSRTSGTSSNLNGVYWNGSMAIAVGSTGVILSSTNGTTWTSRTSPVSVLFYWVTWGNSMWVAVGASGNIVSSPDGVTWTDRTNTQYTTQLLEHVMWTGSYFVIVGDAGSMITSTNGTSWTYHPVASNGTNISGSVMYKGRIFICTVSGVTQAGFVTDSIYTDSFVTKAPTGTYRCLGKSGSNEGISRSYLWTRTA
jgi:hypothetical protein